MVCFIIAVFIVKFTIHLGTGLSVFGIVPTRNNNQTALATTNITFVLDGKQMEQTFISKPVFDGKLPPDFNYSVPIFAQQNLEDGQHRLVIMAELGSMLFLDSVNVTTSGDGPKISGGVATK